MKKTTVFLILAAAATSANAAVILDLTRAGANQGSTGLNQTTWDDFDLGNGWTADIAVTTSGGTLNTIAIGYGVAGDPEANRLGPGETITFTFSDFKGGVTDINFLGFISENNTGVWNIASADGTNSTADVMLVNGTSYSPGTFASATAVTPSLNFNSSYVLQSLGSPVALNGDDEFVIGMSAGTARLSGLQFEAVPEPSSAALLGLASLGLILRRRRA